MTPKRKHKEKPGQRDHQTIAEDERGWAGQHGQRPANQEEKNYRTGGEDGSKSRRG